MGGNFREQTQSPTNMRISHRFARHTLLAIVALMWVSAQPQTGIAAESVPPRYKLTNVPKGYQLCNAEDDYESYSTSRGNYVSIVRHASSVKEYRIQGSPSFNKDPQEYADNLVKSGATATKVHGLPASYSTKGAMTIITWIEKATFLSVLSAGETTQTALTFAENVVPTGKQTQPFTLKSLPNGYKSLYNGSSRTQVPPKPAALSHVGWRLEKDGSELGSLSLDISFQMPNLLDVFFGPTSGAAKTTVNKKAAVQRTSEQGERAIMWMQEPEVFVVVRSSKLDFAALTAAASSITPWSEKAFQQLADKPC